MYNCVMDNVTELDDHRPQMVIETPQSVHVIPVRAIERIASGEVKADTKTAQCLAVALMDEMNAS